MTGPVFRTLIPSLPLFSSKFQQPPAHHPLATIRNPSLTLVAEPFSSPWVPSLPVEKSARPSSRRSSSPGRRTKGCIELLASLSRRIAGFVGRCLSELTVSLSELTFLFKLSLSLCLSSLSFSVAVISDSVVTVTSFLPRCRSDQSFFPSLDDMGARGVVGDKWSMRILWACALGSAAGLYMVAVERQKKNREKILAEALNMELGESNGKDV
ncbi:uncharacterized protein [Arachis hypogaea]|uniref:uncharacterized protein isoform X1 n=1 Tax=Arachis hypogaea TaxID=3818 RepID=UPI003B226C18